MKNTYKLHIFILLNCFIALYSIEAILPNNSNSSCRVNCNTSNCENKKEDCLNNCGADEKCKNECSVDYFICMEECRVSCKMCITACYYCENTCEDEECKRSCYIEGDKCLDNSCLAKILNLD